MTHPRPLRALAVGAALLVLAGGCASGTPAPSFVDVRGGEQHTCAIDDKGAIWCWGANRFGQLGNGTLTATSAPTKIPTRVSFKAVAPGKTHTCALDIGGGVWCWGGNFVGKLGNGSTDSSPIPVRVDGLPGPAVDIAVAADRSCAVTVGGLWCWGDNTQKLFGIDDPRPFLTPTQVLAADVKDVAMSPGRGCLLTDVVLCSGIDTNDDLGGEGSYVGVRIEGLPDDIRELHAGQFLLCARGDDTRVHCWGSMTWYREPDGTWHEGIWLPATPLEGAEGAQITMMDSTVCTLDDGLAYCYGARPGADWIRIGGIGMPDVTSESLGTPWRVGFPGRVAALGGGAAHLCAIDGNGDVWCLGHNDYGQLGDGTTTGRSEPVRVTFG